MKFNTLPDSKCLLGYLLEQIFENCETLWRNNFNDVTVHEHILIKSYHMNILIIPSKYGLLQVVDYVSSSENAESRYHVRAYFHCNYTEAIGNIYFDTY